MTQDPEERRRALLQMAAAGLAAAGGASTAVAATPPATGKPGDFDFLTGHWKIKNRQLKKDGGWDEFEGEASVFALLQGVVSIEELRIPARGFSGMGLRVLSAERKLWADYCVNAQFGIVGSEPTWGSFVDGVGTWDAEDKDGDPPVIWRGVWDQVTPKSCRWVQASSRDGGGSWKEQWVMHWTCA